MIGSVLWCFSAVLVAESLFPCAVLARREALLSLGATALVARAAPATAGAASSSSVGSYLPSAGVADFVLYKPDANATPSLRAGVIRSLYSFALPPDFSAKNISNTETGNFCM